MYLKHTHSIWLYDFQVLQNNCEASESLLDIYHSESAHNSAGTYSKLLMI